MKSSRTLGLLILAVVVFATGGLGFVWFSAEAMTSTSAVSSPLPVLSPTLIHQPSDLDLGGKLTTSISTDTTSSSVSVSASEGWVHTGVWVNVGDAITITSSGEWTPGPPAEGMIGPDGSSVTWPDNFLNHQDIGSCGSCARARTPHWGALVGYIGNNPPDFGSYTSPDVLPDARRVFVVGSNYVTRTVLSGGLWLNINDDAYSGNTLDNGGHLHPYEAKEALGSTPTPMITPTPTLHPGMGTLVLQNGSAGYDGADDTWLDSFNPDIANGVGSARNFLRLYPGNQQNVLIRFDLTSVIPGLPIHQALLKLYLASRTNTNSMWADAYEMKREWVDGEATWNLARSGVPWDVPGANGLPDRSQVSSGLMTLAQPDGTWVTLDVTNLVKKWLAEPESNYGILLQGRPGGGVQYAFRSSDHPDQLYRPKLELYYWQIQVTSTPTPTARPTATPTFTATPIKTPTPTPTDARLGQFLYMEAERGVFEEEMRSYFDENASACFFAASPYLNGSLTLTFRVNQAGNYWLWGRTRADHVGENSVFVSVNNGPAFRWDFPVTSEWTWNQMRDTNTSLWPHFSLGASTHTITIRPREAGSKLDLVALTSDSQATPAYIMPCASLLTPEPTVTPTATSSPTPTGRFALLPMIIK